MSFQKNLREGQSIEDEFIDLLKTEFHYSYAFKPEGKCNWFDIIAVTNKGKIETFEVKSDNKWNKTGNVALETFYKGKASCILASLAEYIVYFLEGDNFYTIKSKDLRRWIYLNEDNKRIVNGGDGDNSRIVLVPIEEFKLLFSAIDI